LAKKKIRTIFFGVLFPLLCLAFVLPPYIRRPEITPAMRGKIVAGRLGCFGCHGPEGFGGIPDPISPAGKAPGWEKGTAILYVNSEEEIEEWILHGRVLNPLPQVATLPETMTPMPPYKGLLSEREKNDLIAYFKAVAEYFPEMPDRAYEGSVIAHDYGCFGCHGPSGMGGLRNPKSFTGIIPSWDGHHFKELVKNDAELREWIMEGTIKRLTEHPIGNFFLKRQVIQMPAYKDQISEEELQNLMIYIKWLQGEEAEDIGADNPIA
jgi:mono/diheme cytochrome c family protein